MVVGAPRPWRYPAAAQRNTYQLRDAREAGDGGLAALGKRNFEIGHRSVPDGIEDEVVAPSVMQEVGRGVVDDVIGAQRTDEVDVPGASHAGHLGPV